MFLSLFLISLLVLSGCEQSSFSGYATKEGEKETKSSASDSKDIQVSKSDEKKEVKSSPEDKKISFPGIPVSSPSEQVPAQRCEDHVYSNCPNECTKICIPSSTRNPEDSLVDCQDVGGSCVTPFEEDDEGYVSEGVCVDVDGDGYGFEYTESVEGFDATCEVFDCDDNNFWVNPGIVEECDGTNYDCELLCNNGIDDDCDGLRDSSDNQEVSLELQVFQDCTGACYSNDECIDAWNYPCLGGLGDGECDSTDSYGIAFNCDTFDNDLGDCDDIGENEIFDCNGESNSNENWIGDGICDVGQYGLDFNCEEYAWDGGDCECTESDLSRCIYGPPNAVGCNEASECEYQYCDGSLFVGNDQALTPEIGTSSNGFSDITSSVIIGGGLPIVSKKDSRTCRAGECGYLTNLDLIGDGYCDEFFNCEIWNYDEGDCDETSYSTETGGYEEILIEEGTFNTELVDSDIFMEGVNPIEFLFSSFLQITEDIILEGHDVVLGQGSEFYYFEKSLKKGEALEFKGLFLDANALTSGRIYDETLYISYEDLQRELPDNLISETHTVNILDIQSGITTNRVSLEIQSDIIRTNIEEGKKELYDINNDEVSDISLEVKSIDEQNNVNIKIAYVYPKVSDNFAELPPEFSPELFSTEKSETFLKASAIFAMILVMFIVSFLLIRKAVSLVRSKK